MKRLLVVWLVAIVTGAWAQEGPRIESFGRMKMAADSPAMKARALRSAEATDFTDEVYNSWYDMYWFRFYYPSVNANGEPVIMSALATFPDGSPDSINNVIIGCHVTITSNKETPSEYYNSGDWKSDTGMLMWHAANGSVFPTSKDNPLYYNLVILPDYEGYGITKDLPHPYLYQELTARQVVDATRYGIALYQESPVIADYRNPLRKGWKTAAVGYSQGSSVALATHRFIEQNDLDEELHFAGSVCGDGPYDPIATVRYYLRENGGLLNMPVVIPLILKGMLDSNPYMKEHEVEDYIVKDFIDTGIFQWIADKNDPEKEKTTDDITDALKKLYSNEKAQKPAEEDKKFMKVLNSDGTAYIQNLFTPQVLEYFSNAENFDALPTTRGICEDLHMALESNNLTKGWLPKNPVAMWHYCSDTVVPYDNATSAMETLGENCKLYTAGTGIDISWDHENGGAVFFTGLNVGKDEEELMEYILTGKGSNMFDGTASTDPSVANVKKVTLSLNGEDIEVEAILDEETHEAVIGNGYNACIPQYSKGKLVIPSTIENNGVTYTVSGVNRLAFHLCNQLIEMEIDKSLEDGVDDFAFAGCYNLKTITYTDSQEMTDGIGDIPNSRDTKDNIYDLNGRKIQDRNHKGIFISDNKKSLRK